MEKTTTRQLHHNPILGGLASPDQNKTNNLIQNRHRHTNKADMMIPIRHYGVVHASQVSKTLKVLSNS